MTTPKTIDNRPCTRRVAVVIGAGVAGCQAARALLRAGYDILVLEQGRGLGGVWRRNYHSFGLQGQQRVAQTSCTAQQEYPILGACSQHSFSKPASCLPCSGNGQKPEGLQGFTQVPGARTPIR